MILPWIFLHSNAYSANPSLNRRNTSQLDRVLIHYDWSVFSFSRTTPSRPREPWISRIRGNDTPQHIPRGLWARSFTLHIPVRATAVLRNSPGDFAAGGSQGEEGFDQQVNRDARVAFFHLGDHIRKRQAVCGVHPTSSRRIDGQLISSVHLCDLRGPKSWIPAFAGMTFRASVEVNDHESLSCAFPAG